MVRIYLMITKLKSFFIISVFSGLFLGSLFAWDKSFFENIEQPIAFPHKLHVVNNGMSCEYCHSGATVSNNAGMPPVRTCIGCHSLVKGRSPEQKTEIQKILDYWEKKEPIPWKKIHDLPDFVRFSHKRHVQAGFDCTNCHGDVSKTKHPVPKPLYEEVPLSMGWCMSCHRDDHAIDENGKVIVPARATLGGRRLNTEPPEAVGVKNGDVDCLVCHK
jgi:hypothetical protein